MDDLISRQKTIDAMRELPYGYRGIVWDILNSLPSAQPTEASCWGCNCPKMERLKEQKPFRKWCIFMMQKGEPMSDDLISRQVAIQAIDGLPNCYNGFSDTYDKACIIGVLEELPSVQSEQKIGKWIIDNGCVCCSECGEPNMEWNYCPNCGAIMDMERE